MEVDGMILKFIHKILHNQNIDNIFISKLISIYNKYDIINAFRDILHDLYLDGYEINNNDDLSNNVDNNIDNIKIARKIILKMSDRNTNIKDIEKYIRKSLYGVSMDTKFAYYKYQNGLIIILALLLNNKNILDIIFYSVNDFISFKPIDYALNNLKFLINNDLIVNNYIPTRYTSFEDKFTTIYLNMFNYYIITAYDNNYKSIGYSESCMYKNIINENDRNILHEIIYNYTLNNNSKNNFNDNYESDNYENGKGQKYKNINFGINKNIDNGGDPSPINNFNNDIDVGHSDIKNILYLSYLNAYISGKGIGKYILHAIYRLALNLNKYIVLSYDETEPWLKNYYEKNGFTLISNNIMYITPATMLKHIQ